MLAFMKPDTIKFGGVPTIVAIPPAMVRAARPVRDSSASLVFSIPAIAVIETTTGSKRYVAHVSPVHILMNPLTRKMPRNSLKGERTTNLSTLARKAKNKESLIFVLEFIIAFNAVRVLRTCIASSLCAPRMRDMVCPLHSADPNSASLILVALWICFL